MEKLGELSFAMATYRQDPELFFKQVRTDLEKLLAEYEPSTGCIFLDMSMTVSGGVR